MIAKIIERYKNFKKQSFLNLPQYFKNEYAFIGVGSHSISNLYPILMYLGVPIKYIYSRKLSNAEKMSVRFNGAIGTNNINGICENKNIKGVFICLKSDIHFDYVKKCLDAGKFVFVDKPPCISTEQLEELIKLEKKKNAICVVGLQRRYSPVYELLSKKLINSTNYNYKFYTGSYPEGNILYDLFIHPIDIITYLFGSTKEIKTNIVKNKKGMSISILSNHNNGCSGIIDLSTMYSWKKIEESLTIVNQKNYYSCKYPFYLKEKKLKGQILGVPLEKVYPSKYEKELLYFDNNGLNPIKEYNTLFYQGFFDEINTFVNLVEGKKAKNKSSLQELKLVYDFIDEIKKNIQDFK